MIEMEELFATGLLSVLIGAWRALPLLAIVLAVDLILRRRIAARFHCLLWTLTDQTIIDQVLRACDAVGARRRPLLKEVDGLAAPAVFGFFRHTICLPPGTITKLSSDEIGWVLKHELAHIKRRDLKMAS